MKKLIPILAVIAAVLALSACASGDSPRGERAVGVVQLPQVDADIEVFPQLGHSSAISSVAYSFDGKYIVSSAQDNTVRKWDTESGRELWTLEIENLGPVAYSPDGKTIVIGGTFGKGNKLLDAETGRELLTFGSSASSVMYSPDGKYIVSGYVDKIIRIWDAEDGRELRTLSGHTDILRSIVYSPDGKYIVSASNDMTIRIWDAEDGRELQKLSGHTDILRSIVYSPDGKYIVSASYDKTIRIWDTDNGKLLKTLSGHQDTVNSAMYSPDGKYIVSGSQDKTIKVWDTESGRLLKTLSGHQDAVNSAMYSLDGKYIVSGSRDKTIKVWDAESGRVLQNLSVPEDTKYNPANPNYSGSVTFVGCSPNGKHIISGTDSGKIRIWDVESGLVVRTLSGHTVTERNATYSPDGTQIVTGSLEGIRIWDVQDGRLLRTFYGHVSTYNPDGKHIAIGSDDCLVRIWDVQNGQLLRTLSGHTSIVNTMVYCLDGTRIVTGSGVANSTDKTVRIWDVQNGQLLITIPHSSLEIKIVSSPDGRYIAFIDSKYLIILDAESGREVTKTSADSTGVRKHLTYSPNGKQIAFRDKDYLIVLDAESGREVTKTFHPSLSSIDLLAYSPDGKRIVYVAGLFGHIWDIETGRTLDLGKVRINSVAYSSDGQHIVTGGLIDKTIRILDAQTGGEIKVLTGHTGDIGSVLYSPDGKQIISTGTDANRIWDVESGKEIAQFISYSGSDSNLSTRAIGLVMETQATATSIDGEWLCIAPDGYYQASPRGDRYLNVRVNNTVSGIDSYRSIFYNPDVVQARLQGKPDPASKKNITIQQAGAFLPPTITIQSPTSFTTTNTATTNLAVTVTDQNLPVKNIRVFVNGRSVGQGELAAVKGDGLKAQRTTLTVTGNQKTVSFTIPLRLDPGPNRIEVVASNSLDVDTRRCVDITWNAPAGQRPPLPNLWVLAVGVNRYDGSAVRDRKTRSENKIKDLSYAVADAKVLIDSLRAQEGKRYAKVNVRLIADTEALKPTAAVIRQNLGFFEQAGDRDVVLLFLAGHGISAQDGKFFFLPSDALVTGDINADGVLENVQVDPGRAISGDDLAAVLEGPGNRLLFIDACNSGGVDSDRMVRSLMESNAFVFAASQGDESSYEDPGSGHGFFTGSILSALGGAPAALAGGNVSVLSLSGFVKNDVSKRVLERYGRNQNPQLYSLLSADFPMARIE